MKMAKPVKMQKVKSAKPAKVKKEKPAKMAQQNKVMEEKPAEDKKSAHFRMYSHDKLQEDNDEAVNHADIKERKRFSSAKEEDDNMHMNVQKTVKRVKKSAKAPVNKPAKRIKNADELMEMDMQK